MSGIDGSSPFDGLLGLTRSEEVHLKEVCEPRGHPKTYIHLQACLLYRFCVGWATELRKRLEPGA